MANPNPSPGTRFGAGQPSNPGGRPRGTSLTAILREKLETATPDGKSVGEVFVEQFLSSGLKGKFAFAKEVWERAEGKVPDRVQIEEVRKVYDVENSPDDL